MVDKHLSRTNWFKHSGGCVDEWKKVYSCRFLLAQFSICFLVCHWMKIGIKVCKYGVIKYTHTHKCLPSKEMFDNPTVEHTCVYVCEYISGFIPTSLSLNGSYSGAFVSFMIRHRDRHEPRPLFVSVYQCIRKLTGRPTIHPYGP